MLNRFREKDVALHIKNDPRTYVGYVVDILDGALVLNNKRYGVSTFDIATITMIQEDAKRRKTCEELPNENETQ